MSVIPSRELTQTSISQVELASHDQLGGCLLKWWLSSVMGLKPDQVRAAREGVAGHALFANYFNTGEIPAKRSMMSKAGTGAIVKGKLPKPGKDLYVELRFDGQDQLYADKRCHCDHLPEDHEGKKHNGACNESLNGDGVELCDCTEYSAKWIPLDREQTLWHAGLPWEGFIDLTFRREDIPEVIDHKFFQPADEREHEDPYVFLKKPKELIKTVQMPICVLNMRRYWPDAKRWKISHHQVSKKGVDSRITSIIVSTDQVLERAAAIAKTVDRMRTHAIVTEPRDIPFNTRSCRTWGGCPHQSVCPRFDPLENIAMSTAPEVPDAGFDLAPDEAELFGVDTPATTTPAPAAAEDDGIPPLDDELTADQAKTAAENDAKVAADKAATKKAAAVAAAKAAAAKAAAELAALEKEEAPPPAPPPAPKKAAPPPANVNPPDAATSTGAPPPTNPPAKPPKKAATTPPAPAGATNATLPASGPSTAAVGSAVSADAGKVIKGGPGSKAALASMFRSIAALIDSVS